MKKRSRSQVVDKKVARVVYDLLNNKFTDEPQVVDNVIHNLRRKAGEIRGAATTLNRFVALEAALKLGFYAGINGKTSFQVTLPDWLPRRWKPVLRRSIACGFQLGAQRSYGTNIAR